MMKIGKRFLIKRKGKRNDDNRRRGRRRKEEYTTSKEVKRELDEKEEGPVTVQKKNKHRYVHRKTK